MEQTEYIKPANENIVCKLNKAIVKGGKKQASRAENIKMKGILKRLNS